MFLFLRDPVASIGRLLLELKGVANIALAPARTVRLTLARYSARVADQLVRVLRGPHSATLLKRGASPKKIELLGAWRHSVLFAEPQRAALDWAETMTRSDARLEDGHFDPAAYFDDDALSS